MKEDKIFNNKFNSGEVEYEVFGKININSDFATSDDMFEDYNEKQIQKDIEDKFMNVSDSTFAKRGDFFSTLVNEIGKLESANKNIKEIIIIFFID